MQGIHPKGTTLAGGISINLFTFLKPDPVTISIGTYKNTIAIQQKVI